MNPLFSEQSKICQALAGHEVWACCGAKWPAGTYSIYRKCIKADLGESLITFKKRGKTFLKLGKDKKAYTDNIFLSSARDIVNLSFKGTVQHRPTANQEGFFLSQ